MEIQERLVAVETQVQNHTDRLNAHSNRIGDLEKHNVKQDSLLEKLCAGQEKTNEMTKKNSEILKEIVVQNKTIRNLVWWAIGAVPVFYSAWEVAKKMGLF